LPAASNTPVSHSSMSAAEFGAEDLFRPLGQIRLGLERCEERQVPALLAVFSYPAADQFQGWPELSLGKLIDQVMELFAHRAHDRILRAANDSAANGVVAEHVLVAPGGVSVRDEHYGGPRPDTPRRAVRPKTAAEREFCALGPVAEAFITGAAAAGHTRLGPELAELNTLRAAYGEQEFLAALDRAVAFCRWRAADVRSILAAGAGLPEPKVAAGDALTLGLPAVPVRPLADYAIGALS
jgi:hypothetical protein